MNKFAYIALTLALTVYGQLIIKARSLIHAPLTAQGSKISYLFAMYTDVGVLSGLAAALIASLCWSLAIENAGIGFAYPFMALSFVIAPLLAHTLFSEAISPMQIFGLAMIVLGVTINAVAYK